MQSDIGGRKDGRKERGTLWKINHLWLSTLFLIPTTHPTQSTAATISNNDNSSKKFISRDQNQHWQGQYCWLLGVNVGNNYLTMHTISDKLCDIGCGGRLVYIQNFALITNQQLSFGIKLSQNCPKMSLTQSMSCLCAVGRIVIY